VGSCAGVAAARRRSTPMGHASSYQSTWHVPMCVWAMPSQQQDVAEAELERAGKTLALVHRMVAGGLGTRQQESLAGFASGECRTAEIPG